MQRGKLWTALLLVAAVQAAAVDTTEHGMWSELLTVDCLGRTHILANTPFAVSYDGGSMEVQHFWLNKILKRAHDRCPTASKDQLKTALLPSLEMFVNVLWGTQTKLPCDTDWKSAFEPVLNPNSIELDVMFPDTCSPRTVQAGRGCLLNIDLPDLPDSNIHIAADSCPESEHNMFLSVTLSGALSNFLQPCNDNTECRNGLGCAALPGDVHDYETVLRSALEDMNMFDSASDRQECVSNADLLGDLRKFLTNTFFNGQGATTAGLQFCGLDMFLEAMDDPMVRAMMSEAEPPHRRTAAALSVLAAQAKERFMADFASLRERAVTLWSHSSAHRRALVSAAQLAQDVSSFFSSLKDRATSFFSSSSSAPELPPAPRRSLLQLPPPPAAPPADSHDHTHSAHSDDHAHSAHSDDHAHSAHSDHSEATEAETASSSWGWSAGGHGGGYGGGGGFGGANHGDGQDAYYDFVDYDSSNEAGYWDSYADASWGYAEGGVVPAEALEALEALSAGLSRWEGRLPSGAQALGEARKSGEVFGAGLERPRFAGAHRPLLGVRGEAGSVFLQLSDHLGMSLAMPHLSAVLDFGARALKRVQDCRGDGSEMPPEEFRARFLPWTPEAAMASGTVLQRSSLQWKRMTDPIFGGRRPDFSPQGKLQTPDTCTYGAWVAGDGRCSMAFSGLSSMFRVEGLVLGVAMHKPSYAGGQNLGSLPSMEVTCQGDMCSSVAELAFCASDADCSSGSGMACEGLVYTRDGGEQLTVDVVAEALWSGACGVFAFEHAAQCSAPSFRREVREFLASLRNDAGAALQGRECPAEQSSNIAVCAPDMDRLDLDWMFSEMQTLPSGALSLRHLQPWDGVGLSPSAPPATSSLPAIGKGWGGASGSRPHASHNQHSTQQEHSRTGEHSETSPAAFVPVFCLGLAVGAVVAGLLALLIDVRRRYTAAMALPVGTPAPPRTLLADDSVATEAAKV